MHAKKLESDGATTKTNKNEKKEKMTGHFVKKERSNVESANAILEDLEAMKSVLRPPGSYPFRPTKSGDTQQREARTKEQILADLDELISDSN